MRQPIIAVLGHVDSGKTSLLDNIRGTLVQKREAGGITQHIGASFLPIDIIKKICGDLYIKLNKSHIDKIPGILFIDTPGHEVFTNLRTRGGSAADIAILVVDITSGFQPQTIESLKILESKKVPFVIALNKIDMISGWKNIDTKLISTSIEKQDQYTKTIIDEQSYNVVGSLSQLGYPSELFTRIKDFTKEISIIPISARFGIGIPELLAVLTGLTQQYLEKKLSKKTHNKGIVIEINNEQGLGQTANVILIDGHIQKDDFIVIAKHESVVVSKLKTILLPRPLDEMRDPRDKFKPVTEVHAAAGIKIASQDLDDVLPGSTIYATKNKYELDLLTKLLETELKSVFIKTKQIGITVKCDTIGSLEALTEMLKKAEIPVASANIGAINRRDIMEAKVIKENDRHLGVILAFNVKTLLDAKNEADDNHIKIFEDNVIYTLLDKYSEWVKTDTANEETSIFSEITPISKFTFLKDYVFRNSNPAVFGIKIDIGLLRQKVSIMNKQGKKIGIIHQLQKDGKTVTIANTGEELACSIQDITIGRQIFEGDIFYTMPSSYETKQLVTKLSHKLHTDQIKILHEIIDIKRRNDPAYGY